MVGTARDGLDALEKIPQLKPDIVTLDVEMPRMDGLACLKKIMQDHPLPVLMVSSLTQEGAQATLEALALGALDFIPKESSLASGSILQIQQDLQEKVRKLARSPRFRKPAPRPVPLPAAPRPGLAAPAPVGVRPAPGGVISGGMAELFAIGCLHWGAQGPAGSAAYLPRVCRCLASSCKAHARQLHQALR